MKLGFDYDGVVADSSQLKASLAMELYGLHIPPDKFHFHILHEKGVLTTAQYAELTEMIYHRRPVAARMVPVWNAIKYIRLLLLDVSHSVTVITSRDPEASLIAEEWTLSQHVRPKLVGVGPGNSKAEVLAGFDVYVDDDVSKLASLVGVVRHLFLLSWPYNAHEDVSGIARRVASWDDLYEAIQALELEGSQQ